MLIHSNKRTRNFSREETKKFRQRVFWALSKKTSDNENKTSSSFVSRNNSESGTLERLLCFHTRLCETLKENNNNERTENISLIYS